MPNTVYLLVAGYLIGSVSFGQLVLRVLFPGARPQAASQVGCVTSLADLLKGLIPTLLAKTLLPGPYEALVLGAGIVAGHVWPLLGRMRGRRGMAPTLGVLLALDPLGALVVVAAGYLASFVATSSLRLGWVIALLLTLPWAYWRGSQWPVLGVLAALNALNWLATLAVVRRVAALRSQGLESPWLDAIAEPPAEVGLEAAEGWLRQRLPGFRRID
jgi:glycerol-3-phosphate acyltransferase PlsY